MEDKKLIDVRDLTYVYNPGMPGETTALDGVSFSVTEPCIMGIIGHTGSGKSTLLQHLNGLIKPTSGEIYIDGECITESGKNLTEVRRKVGLVFQYPEYQLFEETVAADVAFGPGNLGVAEDKIEEGIRRAIEMVGLEYEDIKDESPFELSGGTKRRVAIAGVIAMEPEILMLDEPTAGLDPAAHRDILTMIRRVQQETGMVIILVSHNMSDIAMLTSRVLVMSEGRIVMDGSPREIFSRSEELRTMGLAVPPAAEIADAIGMQVRGFRSSPLSIDELAVDIKQFAESSKTSKSNL